MASYNAINYSNISPPILPHKAKIAKWAPLGTYGQNMNAGDIIRFNIRTDNFWDPYSAYVEITVDVSNNQSLNNVGVGNDEKDRCLQIDSSCNSIFSQLIVYEQSDELERIMQLDVLMAMLKDIDYDTGAKFARDYEGLGGIYSQSTPNQVTTSVARTTDVITKVKNWLPTMDFNKINNAGYAYPEDVTRPYSLIHSQVSNQTGFTPYMGFVNQTFSAGTVDAEKANNFWVDPAFPADYNTPGVDWCGLDRPFEPAFCQNGMEPFFSKTVPQRFLRNGFIKVEPVQQMTFIFF